MLIPKSGKRSARSSKATLVPAWGCAKAGDSLTFTMKGSDIAAMLFAGSPSVAYGVARAELERGRDRGARAERARSRVVRGPQASHARDPAPGWLAAYQRHRDHLQRGGAVVREHAGRGQ